MRLAVTLGDPRGIGPEVVRRALDAGPTGADVTLIGADEQVAAAGTGRTIGVGPWGDGTGGDAAAGRIAAESVARAVALVRAGDAHAVVTGPVHKQALHRAGFRYPGLTEFLAHLAGDVEVAMMLAAGPLRVVLVTTHLPLREAIAGLSTDRIVRAGKIAKLALTKWWGIAAPRLALCAVNPHAGEGGLFGSEDDTILAPAAAALGAAGPLPADTVFVRALKGEFDAVLAPYHDVGMTAVKVAGFGKGVNVTLGLPFIRTAPDHGTAFDIAGKGVADASSMRAAVELAVKLAGAPAP